jgi:hypothetical protein
MAIISGFVHSLMRWFDLFGIRVIFEYDPY